jgi:DNA-binding NtrC family response regulator
MRRYRRTFFDRMGEFVTLVTGPSGSGKELVARAIALSRYLPFDERDRSFPSPDLFHPVHIAALSANLVESELFGHRKGAFTGAVQDRRGYLDTCPALGAVFLDEIGELSPDVQVKLLRVIETRTFSSVGDTARKHFGGKLIAATHRDVAAMVAHGAFREDLYYRMCSDLVETPSLATQLADAPEALADLIRYMAVRHGGAEAESIAGDAIEWVRTHLGEGYDWPGNYRELEQFVRNFIIRRDYRPARSPSHAAEDLFAPAREGDLTADELLTRYCTLVYSQTGSYEAAARKLALDRRTVKARVDEHLLSRLRSGAIH